MTSFDRADQGANHHIGQIRTYRLGMAHLAPEGLSEQWLLRECGDIHWLLLADAAGLDRAVFVDDAGQPAYAAFCATALDLAAPAAPLLATDIVVTSNIFRLGRGRIGSAHVVSNAGMELALLHMISTFVSHDETGLNRRIVRNHAIRDVILPDAPPGLIELNRRARTIAKTEPSPGTDRLYRETPCPSLDFNAVGLLYFPVFSRLAERAQWAGQKKLAPLARWVLVYLGNLDSGDSVDVAGRSDALDIYRDDGQRIAHVITARHGHSQVPAVATRGTASVPT